MPYRTPSGGYERASRLGHTRSVLQARADQLEYHVPAEQIRDIDWLAPLLVPATTLAGPRPDPDWVLAIDGSHIEVAAREQFPSVLFAFLQVAGVAVDLTALNQQAAERFVDPVAIRKAQSTSLLSGDLPSSGAYIKPGVDSRESWRLGIFEIFSKKRITAGGAAQRTLLDLLFWLHGDPNNAATEVVVSHCPGRLDGVDCDERNIHVAKTPTHCPKCNTTIYPTDVLRIWEEVVEYGTNGVPLGRLSQVIELLVTIGLISLFFWQRPPDLGHMVFIVDGPLATFGPSAPMKSQALRYIQSMRTSLATRDIEGPFVVGVEKTGPFADFAIAIARHTEAIKPGTLVRVDEEIICRVLNRSNAVGYSRDEFWGRRFFYMTTDHRMLVITVPPDTGNPYDNHLGKTDPAGYSSLPGILEVLDRTGTRLYQDAIIPIALAHEAASYPLGVGSDVLRLVAREKLGLANATGE